MPRSFRLVPLAALLPLTVVACGGGPKHISDITPQVRERLSGSWVLDEDESDDPEEALARPTADGAVRPGGRPGPRTGGRGGAMGGRGGMSGGATGGQRPAVRGEGNPEAMRLTRRLATMPPRTLSISLSDSLVVLSAPREEPWLLPFGESVERELEDELVVKAKAEWENGRVIVTRAVDGGGSVTETFMPSVDGERLTVNVAFSPGRRGGVEFQRIYTAAPRTGGGADATR